MSHEVTDTNSFLLRNYEQLNLKPEIMSWRHLILSSSNVCYSSLSIFRSLTQTHQLLNQIFYARINTNQDLEKNLILFSYTYIIYGVEISNFSHGYRLFVFVFFYLFKDIILKFSYLTDVMTYPTFWIICVGTNLCLHFFPNNIVLFIYYFNL